MYRQTRSVQRIWRVILRAGKYMDHVSKSVRSRIMGSVKSKGNRTTELALGRILRENQLIGYRKHWRVSGRPDFAWPGLKLAVFVDGCFWHGCPRCDRPSKSNLAFWRKKIANNQQRDRSVTETLRRAGWRVVRIWECRVASASSISKIVRAVHTARGLRFKSGIRRKQGTAGKT